MQLSTIAAACGIHDSGKFNGDISSIEYDSRQVRPGSAFFALPGLHTDGHAHISHALERGAVAVFCEKEPPPHPGPGSAGQDSAGPGSPAHGLPAFLCVENSRVALSQASAAFFGYPEKELLLIGVTGTDGKSSTVSFIHQLLEACSIPAGYISTVAIQSRSTSVRNTLRQSTPEAPEIHRLLREMLNAGKLVAVVESTSHGLSDKTARLYSLQYDGAVFTNIDHEHLEFHGSFEQYLSDKANLFRKLRAIDPQKMERILKHYTPRPGFTAPDKGLALIHKNDAQFPYLSAVARGNNATVESFYITEDNSDHAENTITASQVQTYLDHSVFLLKRQGSTAHIRFPIPGTFNIENILASAGVLYCLFGIPLETLAQNIGTLKAVPGRMRGISEGQNFDVLVDYAHTPGSFRKLFPMLRKSCTGRLIAVFGSAGERDSEKRAIQGAIAARYADIIILSNEDPRLENPMAIIDDIARGAEAARNVEAAEATRVSDCVIHKIPDRRKAIEKAVELAVKDDMIVLLGKGHESSIITADGIVPWNEEAVVRTALRESAYKAQDR